MPDNFKFKFSASRSGYRWGAYNTVPHACDIEHDAPGRASASGKQLIRVPRQFLTGGPIIIVTRNEHLPQSGVNSPRVHLTPGRCNSGSILSFSSFTFTHYLLFDTLSFVRHGSARTDEHTSGFSDREGQQDRKGVHYSVSRCKSKFGRVTALTLHIAES